MTQRNARPRTILIITDGQDATVEYVTKYFRNTESLLLDPAAIVGGAELTFDCTEEELALTWADPGGGEVRRLGRIGSIWYRKPRAFSTMELPVSSGNLNYSRSALESHVAALQAVFPTASWVSHPSRLRRAAAKPMQLALARHLGLHVPRTIFTSSSERAREFVRANGPCIVKSSSSWHPDTGGLFTRLIDPGDDFRHMSLAPAAFQPAIPTSYNVRVVVIDRMVFASRIDSEPRAEPTPVMDWRFDQLEGRARFTACRDLPAHVSAACVELVRRLELRFGAIDLLVDPDGEIWFLEVNPNGQWAFADDETTALIGAALARLLEHPEEIGG